MAISRDSKGANAPFEGLTVEFLISLINELPEGIFFKDLHGRFILANRAVAEHTGAENPEALIGKTDYDFYSKEVADELFSDEQRLIETGQLLRDKEEHKVIRGSRRSMLVTKAPVNGRDGKVLGLVGISRDVTQQKQTEESLRNERNLLRSFIDIVPYTMYTKDTNARKTMANPVDVRTSGFESEAEVLGKTDLDFFPREAAERFLADDRSVIETGQPIIDREEHYTDPAGTTRWVLTSKVPLRDQQGAVVGLAGVGMDITDRKRGEADLAFERTLIKALMENVPDRIYFKDAESRFLRISKAQATIFGLGDPNEAIGKNDSDFFTGSHSQEAYDDERSILRTGRPILGKEERETWPEREDTWVLSDKMPLYDSEGSIIGTFGISRDITQSKKGEVALRRLNRELHAISSCNQILVRAADEQTLLNDICRTVCDQAGYRMAWVGYAEQNEARSVRPVAWAGIEESDIADANVSWADNERGQGSSSVAVRTGQISIVQDCLNDPLVAPWREKALLLGYRSSVGLPLKNEDGQTFGMLGIYSGELNAFTPDEVRLLEELAVELAYGITTLRTRTEGRRARLENDLRLAELDAINRVSSAMRSARSLEEMLPLLLDSTLKVMGLTTGAIWLHEANQNSIRVVSLHGYGDEQDMLLRMREKPGAGIVGRIFASGEPDISNNLDTDVRLPESIRTRLKPGTSSIGVAIRVERAVIGVFTLNGEAPRVFTNSEVKLLTTLCEIAGSAIQRASLHDQTERRYRHLVALTDIDKAITSTFDLGVCLSTVLKSVSRELEADASDVLVFNPGTGKLEFFAGTGFRTTAVERTHLGIGEHYAGAAALERRQIIIDDLGNSKEASVQRALLLGEEFVSYCAVPLVAKGQIKGVLEVFHRRRFEPDLEWLGALDAFAGQAAIAIEDITLFDSLQRSNVEISLAYDATIEGWSRALDLRDKETEGHTQRVTDLSVRLCRHFGLSEPELVHVRRGALLHDIGKMGVPDTILLKAGPLTDEEWVLMKKHPTLAYELLRPIHYLRQSLDIPYRHHEKWDGSGYPGGLKGDLIPLVARVFSVVDVWDALTSDRPYRPAWTKERTIEHIRSLSGSHFDPDVVRQSLESGILS